MKTFRTPRFREAAKRMCAALSLTLMIAAPMVGTLEACYQVQADPAPRGLECYCCKNDEAGRSCCAFGGRAVTEKIATCTCTSKQSGVVSPDSTCLDEPEVPAALSSGPVRYHAVVACRIFDRSGTLDRPPPA